MSLYEGACGKGVWERYRLSFFSFGYLHENPQTIVPLVKDWMRVCDGLHDVCHLSDKHAHPARLIQIVDLKEGTLRLIDGTSCKIDYSTLSYRWGDTSSSQYVTTKHNLAARCIKFAFASMPKTIRDAIIVAQWLDIKYIWIDAV